MNLYKVSLLKKENQAEVSLLGYIIVSKNLFFAKEISTDTKISIYRSIKEVNDGD